MVSVRMQNLPKPEIITIQKRARHIAPQEHVAPFSRPKGSQSDCPCRVETMITRLSLLLLLLFSISCKQECKTAVLRPSKETMEQYEQATRVVGKVNEQQYVSGLSAKILHEGYERDDTVFIRASISNDTDKEIRIPYRLVFGDGYAFDLIDKDGYRLPPCPEIKENNDLEVVFPPNYTYRFVRYRISLGNWYFASPRREHHVPGCYQLQLRGIRSNSITLDIQ